MNPLLVKDWVAFLMSSLVVLFVLVYVLHIPQLISGNSPLVHEYYFKNFHIHIPLDVILLFFYLQFSLVLIRMSTIRQEAYKILMVALGTILLSGAFCLYFLSQPKSSSFFSRWFHSVTYRAILYDVILLVFTYIIFRFLQNKVK